MKLRVFGVVFGAMIKVLMQIQNGLIKWLRNTKILRHNHVITVEELQNALKKLQKWKSLGIDKVPNFWLSHMSAMHKLLAKQMSEIISEPDKIPKWLAEGITFLLAKTPETTNAKNFRPIACLSATFIILTSVLTDRMYTFMEASNLFPSEQKGCKRGSYGCKD